MIFSFSNIFGYIIPNTFYIIDISKQDYNINEVNAVITWNKKPIQDSIIVTYRVFPYKLNAVSRRMDYALIKDRFKEENPFSQTIIDYTQDFDVDISHWDQNNVIENVDIA